MGSLLEWEELLEKENGHQSVILPGGIPWTDGLVSLSPWDLKLNTTELSD